MNRSSFLAITAVMLSVSKHARALAQGDAQTQALRVLLGGGDAQAIDGNTFSYGGRVYRGTFSRDAAGQIVNLVPLEEYLYSVVPREMPRTWEPAALQAQAILARTYVLQRSDPLRAYDLVPSQEDQVYTGVDAERAQTTAAVDATRGRVLRFAGGFAQIAYSSCCGGHTESSALAWAGGLDLPYLRGVVCPYCTQSPWYRWSRVFSPAQMARALGAQLSGIGTLQSVGIVASDASGRANVLQLVGSCASTTMRAAAFRRTLGTRSVPSLLFMRLTMEPNANLDIDGGGLGHGVGLCQWGAQGYALTGAGPEEILSFYFPQTTIGID